ncbi:DUF2092 domain-containing protein [Yinghuangia sp. ASG 101]|uniref:LolA family protein n=1 Tax=Yinghuangia sp. ASG 101 TaxID=2896848 RepID=UPI001E4EB389|nr:DUF2092 domain-containing protein [Yinghuangia sp. ASG 101]UGQ14682.1 DUF2092 domain-containing protein [Yinghuangia sp. ASG 101]
MPALLRTTGKVALPLGIAALAAGAIAYGPSAFADDDSDPNLPSVTAEELVARIAGARTEALSGSIRLGTHLGLPALPGGSGAANPNALVTGTHTLRVAIDGPDRQRVGIQADLAEYNIVHNGRDVWTYDSRANKATHTTLPEDAAAPPAGALATTPRDAARQLLAAADPTTRVTVAGTDKVAGRDAYRLRIAPGQPGSLIGGATVAVDAETGVPLRVVVDTAKGGKPAVDIGFTEVSFAKPSAGTFDFKPPSGAKVQERNGDSSDDTKNAAGPFDLGKLTASLGTEGSTNGDGVRTHGQGWTTVVELPVATGLPATDDKAGADGAKPDGKPPAGIAALLDKAGTPADGPWGHGTLFTTRLATVLVTDDGRVFAGAVDGDTLRRVVAESAAGR